MNTINVVAAVIKHKDKIFATQRGYGEFKGGWEFPGGKVKPGESRREALRREIEEELLCEVTIADEVCTSIQRYDFGTVQLTTFICHLESCTPHLTEHQEIRWERPEDMPSLDWAPADVEAVQLISTMNFDRKQAT